jgi:hypothetical protein
MAKDTKELHRQRSMGQQNGSTTTAQLRQSIVKHVACTRSFLCYQSACCQRAKPNSRAFWSDFVQFGSLELIKQTIQKRVASAHLGCGPVVVPLPHLRLQNGHLSAQLLHLPLEPLVPSPGLVQLLLQAVCSLPLLRCSVSGL